MTAVTLNCEEAAHLLVLLDNAVPRETFGPMAWEGAGRRYAESLLGARPRCLCPSGPGAPTTINCPVHDPGPEHSDRVPIPADAERPRGLLAELAYLLNREGLDALTGLADDVLADALISIAHVISTAHIRAAARTVGVAPSQGVAAGGDR